MNPSSFFRSFMLGRVALLALSLFSFSPIVFAQQTTVSVVTNDSAEKTYSVVFDGRPRVSQVVEQGLTLVTQERPNKLAHAADVIYWQGAGLFDSSASNDSDVLLADITTKLTTLAERWQDDEDKLSAVNALSEFLASSIFQTRIAVELDQDFYLAGSNVNPLVKGELTLLLPPRPNHVWVIGAVEKANDTDFSPRHIAGDYLKLAETLNTFGINDVSVIQPGGALETHHVAYWNEIPKNIAPGAVIFVPFQGLPSALASLNRDIARLLQHRVM
ncbi:polysaccharide synthesis [Enterovibrio norvegicus FF-454]|uniref:Polysaccharide synthesis n=1 Tax=Enterovibrio norvegicus FF-454 TaxID=1185651 RepID=A0A1E5C6H5_9GAMM|nr:capsule biosynthesis GfcC family protein [Enterovibrio norvegicus]OEE61118.1 polysaccharide synthesis [Enterovibrio norvegicus FF-454]